jgi:hypothetical protein
MERLGRRANLALALASVFALLLTGPGWEIAPAWADDADRAFEERQHERGIVLREIARDRAESRLGYDDVGYDPRNRTIDYYALSAQVAHLWALLQAMAPDSQGYVAPPSPPAPPGWLGAAGPESGVAAVYGPQGPNERSVRLLLEYRLMVVGNPRLAVGEIRDEEENVYAQVVTSDGSLVEEYRIEKGTGMWRPVR